MADVPHEAPHKAAKGGIGLLKKMPPWAWVAIAGVVILVALYMRSRANANANSAQAAQGTDPNANTSYDSGTSALDSAYLSGYESGAGGASGGMFGGGGSFGFTPTGTLPAGTGADNTVTTPGTDTSQLAGAAAQPIVINNTYNTPTTGGGAPVRPNVHQSKPSAATKSLLAPGAKAPAYSITRPSNVPKNAKWAGAKSPGKNWKGVGGGWWAPK